jgi:hypothetical protein
VSEQEAMSTMREERKTFTEWENLYGVATFNVDRQNFVAADGTPLTMTSLEFERRVAECLIRRRPFEFNHEVEKVPEPRATRRPTTRTVSRRLMVWLLVLTTLPALATLCVSAVVRVITKYVRIRWLVSACVLVADLIILIIQPIAAVMAGPGYIWYQLLNYLYGLSTRGWVMGQHVLLHRSLNLVGTDHALFSSINVNGSPLSLYFGLSQAIVSSFFWATLLVFAKALFREIGYLPVRSGTASDDSVESLPHQ